MDQGEFWYRKFDIRRPRQVVFATAVCLEGLIFLHEGACSLQTLSRVRYAFPDPFEGKGRRT